MKIKIYYQKSTSYVCYRYPFDYHPESEDDYIEVEQEEAEKTLVAEIGWIWKVVDGKLSYEEDFEYQKTDAYKKEDLEGRIFQAECYLKQTDYVVAKLNELKLEDEEEYEKAKEQYSDVLTARKGARKEINELQAQLAELEAK